MILNLLSLNLHCLEEKNIDRNIMIISKVIRDLNIDVIFFQEVAQIHSESIIFDNIKPSNLAYKIQSMLNLKKTKYYLSFEPIKYSFDKYDEGLAILSKFPLRDKVVTLLSDTKNYYDWRKRVSLKHTILINNITLDLITTHLGWDDQNESFEKQFSILNKIYTNNHALIGVDLNIPYNDIGYENVLSSNYIDLYALNNHKSNDPSYPNKLDIHNKPSRIDYILSKQLYTIIDQRMIFKDPMVSDHYGLYMKLRIESD